MKKPYLLTAGEGYYPRSGTGDWIGCYETYEEAKEQLKVIEHHTYYKSGKLKGQIKSTNKIYQVNKEHGPMDCEWYEIIDLRDWCE